MIDSLSEEEEADSENGDNGSEDCAGSDCLVEKEARREEDDYGSHCHQGGGDASGGVLYSHKGEAHADEGAEEGGGCGHGESFAVVESITQGLHPSAEKHKQGEADETGYAAVEVGSEGEEPGVIEH